MAILGIRCKGCGDYREFKDLPVKYDLKKILAQICFKKYEDFFYCDKCINNIRENNLMKYGKLSKKA